jgi:putative peptidoglycan lipid II flippase
MATYPTETQAAVETDATLNPAVSEAREKAKSRIARSTLVVVTAFATAKVISLVQTFIIANRFGISAEYDAFVSANRAPELIVTLIAGGALGYAFIPIFSGMLAKGDYDNAWDVASQVVNSIFIFSFVVSVLAFIVAPWLVSVVYMPASPPDIQQLAVNMLRILLLSTLIFTISGISADILQSHHHFLSPALAPIMFDVGILIGVIFLTGPLGIYGLAWGAVLGALLHFAVQIPALFRYNARWRPSLGYTSPVFWRVVRLMLPRIAGLGVFYLNFALMNNLANRLGEGAISAVDWGWRLTQIPQTLLGTALGVVIFPTLAALSEAGDDESKRNAMTGAMKFILISTIPAAVGFIVVGRPLISILEGGAFDASATALVYSALQFFALNIIVMSILEIAARSFYADQDTLTPLWAALVGAVVNVVLAIVLSGVWVGAGTVFDMGVGGLALALSLGVTFEISVLIFILRGRWNWSVREALGGTVAKTLIASAVMGAVVMAIGAVWDAAGLTGQGRLLTLVQVGVMTLAGAGVFAGMAALLRMDEIWDMVRVLLRRKRAAVAIAEAA